MKRVTGSAKAGEIMAGYIIPLVAKRTIDFGTLAVGDAEAIPLIDRVDLLHWREVTLIVRVHQVSIAPLAGSIGIGAVGQSWTSEDPDTLFDLGVFIGTQLINETMPAGALLSASLGMVGLFGNVVPPMAGLRAQGTRTNPGALSVVVSAEFSVKDA